MILTVKEMSHIVVGLIDDLLGLFCIYTCNIKIFGCTVCFNSAIASKGMSFPKSYNLF